MIFDRVARDDMSPYSDLTEEIDMKSIHAVQSCSSVMLPVKTFCKFGNYANIIQHNKNNLTYNIW